MIVVFRLTGLLMQRHGHRRQRVGDHRGAQRLHQVGRADDRRHQAGERLFLGSTPASGSAIGSPTMAAASSASASRRASSPAPVAGARSVISGPPPAAPAARPPRPAPHAPAPAAWPAAPPASRCGAGGSRRAPCRPWRSASGPTRRRSSSAPAARLDPAGRLQPLDVPAHRGTRHLLAVGQLADADAGMLLHRAQQLGIERRHAGPLRFAPQRARGAQQRRTQGGPPGRARRAVGCSCGTASRRSCATDIVRLPN